MFETDKQIVERLLIPAMMQTVLVQMQEGLEQHGGILDPVKALLDAAMKEAIADIPPERAGKLARRAKRVTLQAMTALADKVIGVQYLAVAHLTTDLTARDIIVVGAESSFSKAWDMMAEVLSLGWDTLEPLDGEATATAHEMLRALEREGFYRN
jgi:hypothetical protein